MQLNNVNETGTLTSNYPNGKVALQITFNKGNKEGEFFINNDQGKPEYKAFYKDDVVHNDRIEYYANGNIYLKEHFVSNDYEGLQEYFKEDGKPWIKAEYKNDELHGKTQIFTNGVLTLTKKYLWISLWITLHFLQNLGYLNQVCCGYVCGYP